MSIITNKLIREGGAAEQLRVKRGYVGIFGGIQSLPLLKRFMMRPAGVVSKNDIGAQSVESSREENS